jgi:hypothetical protein
MPGRVTGVSPILLENTSAVVVEKRVGSCERWARGRAGVPPAGLRVSRSPPSLANEGPNLGKQSQNPFWAGELS